MVEPQHSPSSNSAVQPFPPPLSPSCLPLLPPSPAPSPPFQADRRGWPRCRGRKVWKASSSSAPPELHLELTPPSPVLLPTWQKTILQYFKSLFFFYHTEQHAGSLLPNQGSNLCPLKWKHGALTTELPGNSLQIY